MQKCSFYVSYILKGIFFSRQNGTVSFEKLKIILCSVKAYFFISEYNLRRNTLNKIKTVSILKKMCQYIKYNNI